jgi:hypothetical protein
MGLADNINVDKTMEKIDFNHLKGLLTPNQLVQLKIIQEALERCVVVDDGNMFLNNLTIRVNNLDDRVIYFDGNSFSVTAPSILGLQ